MRILSQDGTIDVPYEQVVIQRFNTEIYFLNKNLTGVEHLINDMEIASYSCKEKAERAMEMLHHSYIGMTVLFQNCEVSEDLEEMFKRLERCYVITTSADYEPPKVEYLDNVIFQFPKDEDLEA